MIRLAACATSVLAVVTVCALASCSEECVREACEEVRRPQAAAGIDQGITGVVAYSTDVCANGCCECTYASVTLLVHAVDAPIASSADVEGRAADMTIGAEQRYSLELPPGRYAVCTGTFERVCANVVVAAQESVTVNVRTLYGPTQMVVFDARGVEQPDLVVR